MAARRRVRAAFRYSLIHAKIDRLSAVPIAILFLASLDFHPAMPGAVVLPSYSEADFRVIARRNDSLGTRGRWQVFASLCVVSFGLALGFAIFGAWMVLPYSAMEMGVLCCAWRWFERHARDWECVSVDGDLVIVEREHGGKRTKREFNRCWTRLEIEDAGPSRAPRLALRYRGERMHFGDALPAHEREIIARQLRRALAAR